MTYTTTNQQEVPSEWDIYQSTMYELNLPEAISDTDNCYNDNSLEIKMENPYSPMQAYQVG